MAEERARLKEEEEAKSKAPSHSTLIAPGTSDKPRVYRSGVGKYLAKKTLADGDTDRYIQFLIFHEIIISVR